MRLWVRVGVGARVGARVRVRVGFTPSVSTPLETSTHHGRTCLGEG